jgi:hypothetical protein
MQRTFACLLSLAVALCAGPAHSQFNGAIDKMKNKVTGADKCNPDDKNCQNRAQLKGVAVTVAVGIGAKLVAEMLIEAKSEQINEEGTVVKEYKQEFKALPSSPVARDYVVSTEPGNVVNTVSDVKIRSKMVIVPAATTKEMLVEERMTIYDNEDSTKILRSSTKIVNEQTKRGGRFKNEFAFAFPEGVPQGIYPITNELLLDGKPVGTDKKDMQLVLLVDVRGDMRVADLRTAELWSRASTRKVQQNISSQSADVGRMDRRTTEERHAQRGRAPGALSMVRRSPGTTLLVPHGRG